MKYIILLSITFLSFQSAVGQGLPNVLTNPTELVLEETSNTLTVYPRVVPDPQGGYIVADFRENQIRLYDTEGSLKRAFGSRGRGPGEFEYLSSAIRLSSGQILAAEAPGQLSLFESDGTFVRSMSVPVRPLMQLHELENDLVLLVGQSSSAEEVFLLHQFDLTSENLDSFFPVPASVDASFRRLLGAVGDVVAADVRGDCIAAVTSLSETIYLFSKHGELERTVPFNLEHFRALDDADASVQSLGDFSEWVTTFSSVYSLHVLGDESFLFQYVDTVNLSSRELRYSTAHIGSKGRTRFEIFDTSELLTVNPQSDTAIFVHPESLTKERWLTGTL